MKRVHRYVFGFLLGLFLAGCSDTFAPAGREVIALRDQANQIRIKVVRVAPGEDPDQVLVEEQGYYQAMDRMFQLDLLRRRSRGELAEILGQNAVAKDLEFISLGLRSSLPKRTEYLIQKFPETYRILEAYSRGVNRYIRKMMEAPEKNDQETRELYEKITGVLGYRPRDWEPADSIAIAQGMSYYLSGGIREKGFLTSLALKATEGNLAKMKAFTELLDFRPLYGNFIMSADPAQNPYKVDMDKSFGAPVNPIRFLVPFLDKINTRSKCDEADFPVRSCLMPASFGSNNWVVSSRVTGSGSSYLANDPHLPLRFPMMFYEMALDAKPAGGKMRVRGNNIPGVPGILIGHNDDIAWGMTNLGADVDDLFLDMVANEKETGVFNFNAEEIPFTSEEINLIVRTPTGSTTTQKFQLRFLPHRGPVISDHMQDFKPLVAKLEEKLGTKVVVSYKWVGHEPTGEIAAVLGVNKAGSIAEAKASLRNFGVGSQNFVMADRDGEIGYFAHGKFPVRKYAGFEIGLTEEKAEYAKKWPPYLMVMPSKDNIGYTLENFQWEKEFRKTIPELNNPSQGYIVTANNDPFGLSGAKNLSNFKEYFGYNSSTGSRAYAIEQNLKQLLKQGRMGWQDMAKMQLDSRDLTLEAFGESFLRKYQASIDVALKGNISDMQVGILNKLFPGEWKDKAATLQAMEAMKAKAQVVLARILSAWNYQMLRSSEEAVLGAVWSKFTAFSFVHYLFPISVDINEDHIRSPIISKSLYYNLGGILQKSEARGVEILMTSLLATAYHLEANQLEKTTWAHLNPLRFYNELDGVFPALVGFNIGRDGWWDSVNVSSTSNAPNFRVVFEVPQSKNTGAPITAKINMPGGNYHPTRMSERPGLWAEITRWTDGEYRDMVAFIP